METLIGIVLIVGIIALVGYFMFLASRERVGGKAAGDAAGAAQVSSAGVSTGRVSQEAGEAESYFAPPGENEIPLELLVSYLFGVLNDGETAEMKRKLRDQGSYFNPLDRSQPHADHSVSISVDIDGERVELEELSDLMTRWGRRTLEETVEGKTPEKTDEEHQAEYEKEAEAFRAEQAATAAAQERESATEPAPSTPSGGVYASSPQGFVAPPGSAGQAPRPQEPALTQEEIERQLLSDEQEDGEGADDGSAGRERLLVTPPPVAAPQAQAAEAEPEPQEEEEAPAPDPVDDLGIENIFSDEGAVFYQDNRVTAGPAGGEPVTFYPDPSTLSEEGLRLYMESVAEPVEGLDPSRFEERNDDDLSGRYVHGEEEASSAAAGRGPEQRQAEEPAAAPAAESVEIDEETGLPADIVSIVRNPPKGLLGLCMYLNRRFKLNVSFDGMDFSGVVYQIENYVKPYCRSLSNEDLFSFVRSAVGMWMSSLEIIEETGRVDVGGRKVREVDFNL